MTAQQNFVEYPELGVIIMMKETSRYSLYHKLSMAHLVIVASALDDSVFWVYKNRYEVFGHQCVELLNQVFEEYEVTSQGTIRIGESDLVQMRLLAGTS